MGALDFIALLLLLFIVFLIGTLLWFLGGLPGRVAKEHGHPYEQAITVGGWATLLLAGVFWPIVLIWAYAPARHVATKNPSEEALQREIDSLKTQVQALTAQVASGERGRQ